MAVAILDAALVQADHSNLTLAQLARLLAERLRKINLEEIKKYKDDLSALEPAALLDAKEELVTLFNLIKSEDE